MSWNTLSGARATRHDDTTFPLPELPHFARRVFASLPRADQRGWAELYIRGLLSTKGKKSLKRIADSIGMPAATHSLQQFVNQSPWSWDTLAEDVAATSGPAAEVPGPEPAPAPGRAPVRTAPAGSVPAPVRSGARWRPDRTCTRTGPPIDDPSTTRRSRT